MSDPLFYLITSFMYGAIAAYFWRTRWVGGTGAPDGPDAGARREMPPPLTNTERMLVLVPLAAHALLIYSVMFSDGLHFGVGVAISLIVWLTVAIYWLGNLFYPIEGLQALVMPVAAVLVLCTMWLPAGHVPQNMDVPAFRWHLIISVTAYSCFTIASLHVILMALLERRLHGGRLPVMLQQLPPLLTMEKLLFRIIGAGFALLTLTLISGIFFSEEVFGKPLRFDHKTVFGVLSWLIFAALIAGRRFYGWRGRIAMRWTLSGFMMLVLAYIGSKFVLEVILGRT